MTISPLLAQSYGVAKPSEKATAFIAALNQLIAETIAAYNQRMAASRNRRPLPSLRPAETPRARTRSNRHVPPPRRGSGK